MEWAVPAYLSRLFFGCSFCYEWFVIWTLAMAANPLPLMYFSQRDNAHRASNTCNTTACWMAAMYVKPSLWGSASQDPNADYNYFLPLVEDDKWDCTTDHSSQTEALKAIGIESTWRTDFSLSAIRDEIEDGQPVVLGILHNGPVTRPSGGGHMITIVGYDATHMIVHDPNGELDLIGGGYLHGRGDFRRYSFANLSRRAECDFSGRHTPGQNAWVRTFQTRRPT